MTPKGLGRALEGWLAKTLKNQAFGYCFKCLGIATGDD